MERINSRLLTILKSSEKGYITYISRSEKDEIKTIYKDTTGRDADMECGSCMLRVCIELLKLYERENNKGDNDHRAKGQSKNLKGRR